MEKKILEIVSDVLNIEISKVSMETSIENTGVWDSLKQMQIVIAIEEEFGVKISDDDLIEANSVQKLITTINK